MRNKQRKLGQGVCPLLCTGRTTLVVTVVALLMGSVQASWPQGQVELHDQLEASMHSAVIAKLQEAETMAIATQAARFPDSSAVVGRVFQMHVPIKMDASTTVKVSRDVSPALLVRQIM